MSRRAGSCIVLMGAAAIALRIASTQAADSQKAGEWPVYSADNRSTKYSPLDQINKDNVSTLRVAWRRPQADPALLAANPDIRLSNRYTATPIMVNGVMYIPDGFGLVEALDPATGRTLWTQKPLMPAPDGLERRRALGRGRVGARRRDAHFQHAGAVSLRARREERRADRGVRRRREGRLECRPR